MTQLKAFLLATAMLAGAGYAPVALAQFVPSGDPLKGLIEQFDREQQQRKQLFQEWGRQEGLRQQRAQEQRDAERRHRENLEMQQRAFEEQRRQYEQEQFDRNYPSIVPSSPRSGDFGDGYDPQEYGPEGSNCGNAYYDSNGYLHCEG